MTVGYSASGTAKRSLVASNTRCNAPLPAALRSALVAVTLPKPALRAGLSNQQLQRSARRRPAPQAAGAAQRRQRQGLVTAAAAHEHVGSPVGGSNVRFGIVVARFNELVTRLLLAGAQDAFVRHGVPEENVEVTWVPGSYEIPVVASAMARSGRFDAIVCIGAVVRGATSHYDAVAGGAASGILDVGKSTGVPTIFGVLTTENMEQALDRAGGKTGNKGAEAALTALEMANLMTDLRRQQLAAPAWGAQAVPRVRQFDV